MSPRFHTSFAGLLIIAFSSACSKASAPAQTAADTSAQPEANVQQPPPPSEPSPEDPKPEPTDPRPSLPTVAFNPVAFNVCECTGFAVITLALSAASYQPVSVDYTTGDIDATAGVDYTSVSGSLTFSPGQTLIVFNVPISDDLVAESNESLRLTLANPVNAILDSNNPTTLTIVDDDPPPPTVQFMLSNFSAGEGDPVETNLIITLSEG